MTDNLKEIDIETYSCSICGKALNPRREAIVYLMVNRVGFALCAPNPEQVRNQTGSPCVNLFREEAGNLGEAVLPSDEEEYLEERFPA